MAAEQSLRCVDCEEWYDPSDDKQCPICLPDWGLEETEYLKIHGIPVDTDV